MKNIIIAILVGLALILGGILLFQEPPLRGASGPEHLERQDFIAGFTLGPRTPSSTSEFLSGQCATSTWNPGLVPVDQSTSTNVIVSGATLTSTQAYWAGLSTSTLRLALSANVSGTGNLIVVTLSSASGTAAADIETSTVTACFLRIN